MVCSSHGFCWRSCYTELLVPFQVRQSWGVFFPGWNATIYVLQVFAVVAIAIIFLILQVGTVCATLYCLLYVMRTPVTSGFLLFGMLCQHYSLCYFIGMTRSQWIWWNLLMKFKQAQWNWKKTWLFIESLPGLDVTRDLCFCPKISRGPIWLYRAEPVLPHFCLILQRMESYEQVLCMLDCLRLNLPVAEDHWLLEAYVF